MTMTMYTTSWCGHCRRLKRQMDEAGMAYREVDVETEPAAGARIERVTGGYRTVPTVEVSGRLLVNPTIGELLEATSG